MFGSLADDVERNEKSWKEVHIHTCEIVPAILCIIYVTFGVLLPILLLHINLLSVHDLA